MQERFIKERLLTKRSQQQVQWLKFMAIALLVVGIVFRWTNIDQKFFWHDEVINSFNVSGYTVTEATQELSQSEQINFGQLQKYQYPNTVKGFLDPVIVLANNEPQNPPLYYLISWVWFRIFGNSITVARSLSVLISLAIFPCIYWLCRELFRSPATGWIAIVLVAISPFHLIYAQEARPYSLWSLTILLSSIFLLKAIRTANNYSWILYSVTLTLSFYTFPFSLFVAIGQGIYVLTIAKLKQDRAYHKYLLASICSIILYSPWLLFIKLNSHKISDWRAVDASFISLITTWMGNLSRVFIDFNLDSTAPAIYIIPPTLILLLLTVCSLGYLCRKTTVSVWLFVVTLIITTAIALALPDLILGGQRSRVARYLMPSYLGIDLAVAYYLAEEIFSHKLWRQLLSRTLLVLLIIFGIWSCSVSLQADHWWHKSWSKLSSYDDLKQVATVTNQSPESIMIAPDISLFDEDAFFELLSLTHLIKPQIRLQFGLDTKELSIESQNSLRNIASDRLFIYNPLTTALSPIPPERLQPIADSFFELK